MSDIGSSESGAVVYAAIELSRSQWLIAVLPPDAARPSRHAVPAGDSAKLIKLFERVRHQSEQRLGQAVRVRCCYEAGYEGFWLHRVLIAAGIDSLIVDPSSLQTERRARRRKSDGIDVESILYALIAWDRGERRRCSMLRVPDPAIEDERRLTRERGRLVAESTAHRNRIGGLLMTVGIYDFQPLARDRLHRLAALVTGDGRKLPVQLAIEIRREIERLDLVERQLALLEKARRPKRHAQPTPAECRIARLMALKGVGIEIASVLGNEVFWRDFANRREIARYAGLDPSPHDSGDKRFEQGISKAGNRRARWVLIEAAWLWRRWQPDSALARWYHQRVGTATGRLRRLFIAALARKLLVALWHYLKTGNPPEGAVLSA
jgi:transposase